MPEFRVRLVHREDFTKVREAAGGERRTASETVVASCEQEACAIAEARHPNYRYFVCDEIS